MMLSRGIRKWTFPLKQKEGQSTLNKGDQSFDQGDDNAPVILSRREFGSLNPMLDNLFHQGAAFEVYEDVEEDEENFPGNGHYRREASRGIATLSSSSSNDSEFWMRDLEDKENGSALDMPSPKAKLPTEHEQEENHIGLDNVVLNATDENIAGASSREKQQSGNTQHVRSTVHVETSLVTPQDEIVNSPRSDKHLYVMPESSTKSMPSHAPSSRLRLSSNPPPYSKSTSEDSQPVNDNSPSWMLTREKILGSKLVETSEREEGDSCARKEHTSNGSFHTDALDHSSQQQNKSSAVSTSEDPYEWAYVVWRRQGLLPVGVAKKSLPSLEPIKEFGHALTLQSTTVSSELPMVTPKESFVRLDFQGFTDGSPDAIPCGRQSLPLPTKSTHPNGRRNSFANILQQWKEKSDDKPNTHFLSPEQTIPANSIGKKGSEIWPSATQELSDAMAENVVVTQSSESRHKPSKLKKEAAAESVKVQKHEENEPIDGSMTPTMEESASRNATMVRAGPLAHVSTLTSTNPQPPSALRKSTKYRAAAKGHPLVGIVKIDDNSSVANSSISFSVASSNRSHLGALLHVSRTEPDDVNNDDPIPIPTSQASRLKLLDFKKRRESREKDKAERDLMMHEAAPLRKFKSAPKSQGDYKTAVQTLLSKVDILENHPRNEHPIKAEDKKRSQSAPRTTRQVESREVFISSDTMTTVASSKPPPTKIRSKSAPRARGSIPSYSALHIGIGEATSSIDHERQEPSPARSMTSKSFASIRGFDFRQSPSKSMKSENASRTCVRDILTLANSKALDETIPLEVQIGFQQTRSDRIAQATVAITSSNTEDDAVDSPWTRRLVDNIARAEDDGDVISPRESAFSDKPWHHDMVIHQVDSFSERSLPSLHASDRLCQCCSSSLLSINDDMIDFYLPLMSTSCTCGRRPQHFINKDDPTSLENILRFWQAEFLAGFGIHRGDQLVKAHHRSAGALATALRLYRKRQGMTPFRTKSCSLALQIWAKTSKAFVRAIRKQLAQSPTAVLKVPNTLYIVSSFLEKLPTDYAHSSVPVYNPREAPSEDLGYVYQSQQEL